MKKALLTIYLLAFLAFLAGCGGGSIVLGRTDGAVLASQYSTISDDNISQASLNNMEENAAVMQAVQLGQNYNVLLLRTFQSGIFREFANFSSGPFELDMIGGNVALNYVSETAETAAENIVGHIAITFDDGPHPVLTPLLLDALEERGILATFFLLGWAVDSNPDIVARMYEAGHSIGNHSYRHPRFTDISRQRIVDEIEHTNNAILAATGSLPTLLRPPYGARNNTVLDVARQMDMSVVLWSVDPRDWDHRNALLVSENIINYASDGSVVLLHDIHETSIEAAILAIDALIERGYVFVTVEELFSLSELTLQAGEVYRSIYHSIGASQ